MANLTQTQFLAIGQNCWGKGDTPNAALAVAADEMGRESIKSHMMFLVHPETTVNGMGDFRFEPDSPPIELYRVFDGRQYPAGAKKPVKGKKVSSK